MAEVTRKYKDFDLSFTAHPITGDVSKLTDGDAVKQAVKTLVLTENYERFYQPDLGSGVTGYLFENLTPVTAELIKRSILDIIEIYEPRAETLEVIVTPEPERNGFEVYLSFFIVNITDPVEIDFFLERIR